MDPVRDLEIIRDELMAKDVQIVDKYIKDLGKKALRQDSLQEELKALKKAEEYLKEKKWLRFQKFSASEIQLMNKFMFFSAKPLIFLVNQSEKDYLSKNCKFTKPIQGWLEQNGFL